jgi:hypothetical protein
VAPGVPVGDPTSGRTITGKVKVVAAEPGTQLRWVSRLAGVPISERVFRLSPEAGGTVLVQSQTYRGLGGNRAARLTLTALARAQAAFEAINEAVKSEAEARQRASG